MCTFKNTGAITIRMRKKYRIIYGACEKLDTLQRYIYTIARMVVVLTFK